MSLPKQPTAHTSAPDLDILGDQITIHPGGYVEPTSVQGESSERNLVEHMVRFRESPLDFLREVSLHVSGTGWRAYDNFIGQPIFYNGFTDDMKNAVMRTPMLKNRFRQLAQRRVDVEEEQGLFGQGDQKQRRRAKRMEQIESDLQEVAGKLTDGMICNLESKHFIRGAYYVCTQLLTRAYHQGRLLHGWSLVKSGAILTFYFQESMSPAKKSLDYARWQSKPPKKSTQSYFSPVIDRTLIMFHCNSYVTV